MIHTECFMSGDSYKGAERTAGVRATQIYYSAWTGTVHKKCWHFWGMNLVYATKTKAPHWAKRLLDIRGAHNWHSYNGGGGGHTIDIVIMGGGGGGGEQNSCVKRQLRYSKIMCLWEMMPADSVNFSHLAPKLQIVCTLMDLGISLPVRCPVWVKGRYNQTQGRQPWLGLVHVCSVQVHR